MIFAWISIAGAAVGIIGALIDHNWIAAAWATTTAGWAFVAARVLARAKKELTG